MDFDAFSWALERKIRRLYISLLDNTRPTSEPFISGDGFRSIADHIFEKPGPKVDTEKVQEGQIVFVESELLDTYFDTVHPKIKNPYILITHNGDKNIDSTYLPKIDNKIIHWFAQNLLIENPKLTPLPIGLENAHYANAGLKRLYQIHSSDIAEIRDDNVESIRDMRKSRILYSFNADTNPLARGEALAALKDCDTADKLNRGDFVDQPTYVEVLRSYMYVISPAGNGEDCHRTWEALYTGTIPVLKETIMSKQFENLGIPFLSVKSWNELKDMSKYELIAKYDLLWQHANIDALYLDYWKNLILSKKNVS